MPAQAKGNIIQRQWEMLRLIPRHHLPGRTAEDLANALSVRGYSVSRRTVERDLESLSTCMPLAVDEAQRPQRWRWKRSKGVEVPGMEAAEAMALYMMQDTISTHLPSCFAAALEGRFSQANKTLGTLARSGKQVRWSDRVRIVPSHVVLRAPRIAPKIIQNLQKALLNDIPIDVAYQSLHESVPGKRRLYPRALLLRGSSLYLIAHQRDAGEAAAHFAVQRFLAVQLRELEPWPAAPFSLDAFMKDGRGQFGEGTLIELKALISTELYRILRDSPLSDDMRMVEVGGRVTLSATVRDTWALHTWVLGHAEHISILEPEPLRTALAKRIRASADLYA